MGLRPRLMLLVAVLLLPLAARAQRPERLPDLDVLYIERTPRYPGYRPEYGLKGHEGVPLLVDRKTGKVLTEAQARAIKRWPSAGEEVTFTAHVQNRGSGPANGWEYAWLLDGKEVARGTAAGPQGVGEEKTASWKWKWAPGGHTVRFVVDPLFKVRDLSLHNNAREDATDAWSFIWAVDRVTYESFNGLRSFLGTRSFEDWAQWHVDHMNHLFDVSPAPFRRKDGWVPRVRCDRVVVVDSVEPQDAMWEKLLGRGVATLDAGWDGAWPFGRRDDCTEWAANVDWGLIHEWGHQLGLTDLYALDRPGSLNNVTDESGDPLLIGHRSSQEGTMMHGHGPTTFSPECVGALLTQRDRRRGYYGDFYFNIPAVNQLKVLDNAGHPVPGARVSFWQDRDSEYRGKPVFEGATDSAGLFTLPNRPAPRVTTDLGYTQRDNPFGQINVVGPGDVFFIRIQARGHTEYAWLDIPELNLAYWSGRKERAVYERRTHVPPPGAPAAPTGLRAQVDGDTARLTWEPRPGATGYRVYHGGPEEYRYQRIGELSGTTTTETRMGSGALHRYAVTAVGPDGKESGFSSVAGAMHFLKPWGIAVTTEGKRLIRDSGYGQAVLQKADGSTVGLVGSVHYHFGGSYDLGLDSKGRILSAKLGDGYDPKPGFRVQNPDLQLSVDHREPEGSAPGRFREPMGICAGPGDHIFVADTGNDRLQEFTPDGRFVRIIGAGELKRPMKPAFDPSGRLLVADSGNDRIAIFTASPEGYRLAGELRGIPAPVYVAVDRAGRVFASPRDGEAVVMFDSAGKVAWRSSDAGATVRAPRGLAFDPKGRLLIVDASSRSVRDVAPP
jgi:hypothetical protein